MAPHDITHDEGANFVVNITLHIIILFTFLTVLFFTFISQQEENSINNELSSILTTQTKNTLDQLSEQLQQTTGNTLNKNSLNKVANQLIIDSKKAEPFIAKNHKTLLITSICIICGLIGIFGIMVLYYKYIKKVELDLPGIFIENAIIFSFAGLIEYLFFVYIADTYVPVTPDVIANTTFNKISSNFTKILYSQ